MFKKIFIFLSLVAVAVIFWFAFALWTGIYSVYSTQPSRLEPDGSTLIVSREEGEPTFNSPEAPAPPPRKTGTSGGISFAPALHPKRPLAQRTILALPFINWAYQKSLEKPEPEAPK